MLNNLDIVHRHLQPCSLAKNCGKSFCRHHILSISHKARSLVDDIISGKESDFDGCVCAVFDKPDCYSFMSVLDLEVSNEK
jgi:hypothetical protein